MGLFAGFLFTSQFSFYLQTSGIVLRLILSKVEKNLEPPTMIPKARQEALIPVGKRNAFLIKVN